MRDLRIVTEASWDSEVKNRMTPNIASPLFNTLVAAFFVLVLLGVAMGAYAATLMKKREETVKK